MSATKWRPLQQNGHQIRVLHAKINKNGHLNRCKSNMAAVSTVDQVKPSVEQNFGAIFQKFANNLIISIISYRHVK